MARANHLAEPPAHVRPTGARWGSGYAYVDTLPGQPSNFAYKGAAYEIRYLDGCFFPYVYPAT